MGGTDIDSGHTYRGNLAKAVLDGELDVKWARLGLKNSYKMRMMMGLFDPSVDNPYKHIATGGPRGAVKAAWPWAHDDTDSSTWLPQMLSAPTRTSRWHWRAPRQG